MIDKVLGQKISAPTQYDKSILVREERQKNRTDINIFDNNLPFFGYDIWNCWEISCLTNTGLPVTAIAKIVYPCNSKYIVESKSLKLYFNSFNMHKCGELPCDALEWLRTIAQKDLSDLLEVEVKISIFLSCLGNFETAGCKNWLNEYEDWECLDYIEQEGPFKYKESPALLKTLDNPEKLIIPQAFYSTVLRSNCKVTNQPDAGDVYIYIKGTQPVNKKGLLQYIVSFRNENHFHEEICETIYKRLWDTFNPDELFVYCAYVRRGSLDINPIRVSDIGLLPNDLTFSAYPFIKTARQ